MTNVITVQTPREEDSRKRVLEFHAAWVAAVSEGTERRQPSISPRHASLGLLALAAFTYLMWWIGVFNLD